MSRARRAVPVLLVTAIALAAGACGVPTDDEPRAISAGRVPAELLEAPDTTSSTDPEGAERIVLVYFLDGEVLRGVEREVTTRSPETVIGALLGGVMPDDPASLSTAIPDGLRVAQVQRDGTTLVVELSAEIADIQGQLQQVAFAQLVYTVTELAGVEGVLFRVGERDLQVLTDAGAKTEPVTRADFRSLRPN